MVLVAPISCLCLMIYYCHEIVCISASFPTMYLQYPYLSCKFYEGQPSILVTISNSVCHSYDPYLGQSLFIFTSSDPMEEEFCGVHVLRRGKGSLGSWLVGAAMREWGFPALMSPEPMFPHRIFDSTFIILRQAVSEILLCLLYFFHFFSRVFLWFSPHQCMF